LALLVATGLMMAGLSGCGAPAYTYVADSSAKTYYKVPTSWHSVSESSLDQILTSGGQQTTGLWISGFDSGNSPSASNVLGYSPVDPVVFSEVVQLSETASNSLSYDGLRDFLLPVSATGRQAYATNGGSQLIGFRQSRDDTITAANGVHGVRETFEYTVGGVVDTFDEVALTNSAQTVVYFLMAHCISTCYTQNQAGMNTIMSSFTVGSSS
jgi:hypothetical protein